MELTTPASPSQRFSPSSAQPPVTTSKALLGQGSTLLIEHQGSLYTLRVTRNGKLILTK